MEKEKLLEVLKKLKSEKRNFVQSIDLVITLQGIDTKKSNINFFITLPHQVKAKQVCFFAEKAVPELEKIFGKIVVKASFSSYDKKSSKQLAKEFDFFVAQATVMASVASSFGKIFGPTGKMPSPAIGSVVTKLDDKFLRELVERLSRTTRLRTVKNDSSFKLSVGNQNVPDEEITDNIKAVEEGLASNLPKGKENIKTISIKTTMGKPIRLE